MAGFKRVIEVSESMDGSQISVKLRPLKLREVLQIKSHMSSPPKESDNEEMLMEFVNILPDLIIELRGTAEDGTPITVDDLQHSYFARFNSGVMSKLFEEVGPKDF